MIGRRMWVASAALLMAGAALAPGQSGGAVSGRVVSSVHGEPVAGAMVTLRKLEDGPPQSYVTETASDGRFSFASVAPGTYEPRPSKSGYEQRTTDHFATANDFPPVTVEAGKAAEPINLRLIPDGVIAGRVIDADGDPVRRAQVEVQQYGYVSGKKQLRTIRGGQTDDRGQYRMFHMPPGRYFVLVAPQPPRQPTLPRPMPGAVQSQNMPQSMGLASSYYPSSPDPSHATELQLAPGMEIDGVDIRLTEERLYTIRGRVSLDLTKQNINVFAQSNATDARRQLYSQRFDPEGYEIANVPPGKYTVIGQVFPNQPQQQQKNTPTPRQYAMQTVEVVDRDVDHIDLTFAPGTTVKGVVKTEGTLTPKDVLNINFNPEGTGSGFFGAGTNLKPDGTFSVEVAPGVYRVRANGRQAYLKAVLIGKEPAPDTKIDTTRLSGDLTLVMSNDFGKVEGTVVDDAGKPVYNADVTLIPDQRQDNWQQRFRSALTKADGKFSFAAVEPGDYRVYSWLGVEQGAPQDADFRKPFEDRAVVVKVEANGKQTADLKVIQAPK